MDFFKSLIKPNSSQIHSMIRLMIADVNSRISVEKNSIKYVDKAIFRYINQKNKDALIQASQRYVVASRRISGLELIKNAIAKIQSQADCFKYQQPPAELVDPLNTVCWAGHFLNFESVNNFKERVLVSSFGRNTAASFVNSNTLDPDVKSCFYNEEVTEAEYRKLLYDYCSYHNIDNSTVDEIIGPSQTATIKLNYPSLDLDPNLLQSLPPNQNNQIPGQNNQIYGQNNQFAGQNNQIPNFNFKSTLQAPQQPQVPYSSPTFQQIPQFNPNNQPPQYSQTAHLPLQFTQNVPQPPQFTQTTQQPPQFTQNTQQQPQFTPINSISSDEAPGSNSLNNENQNHDFDYSKKPTLASAGSFPFYPGSTPTEKTYKFNENLLPLVNLQPFDKENWPYLQEAVAVATSYDE